MKIIDKKQPSVKYFPRIWTFILIKINANVSNWVQSTDDLDTLKDNLFMNRNAYHFRMFYNIWIKYQICQ